jgi:hypothetical protein
MRKSTLVALLVLGVMLAGMTWVLNVYMDQVKEELDNARALTKETEDALAPGTSVKLRRVSDAPKGIVEPAPGSATPGTSDKQWGLLVEASPSEAAWKDDAAGLAFAHRLARAASKKYGAQRPLQWLKLTLTRPKGGGTAVFGFRVVDDRDVVHVPEKKPPPAR